jgi:DNA-binding NtrC family response regulator
VGLVERNLLEDAFTQRLIPGCLYDYHTLPVDTERLLGTLGHAFGMAEASRRLRGIHTVHVNGYRMIGTSPAMQRVYRDIEKIAKVDAPVMVTGESGTGKELAALAIHKQSDRADGPFVAVNCAALPAELIQSELFGHEKGAFTGAHKRRVGRIEAAHGGTIFLDEIGDVPLDQQVNLLRFLQEKTIERVGGTETIPVDVRVITATHVDLQNAIAQGRFREDLFFRLNVLTLEMPPLRKRQGDVEVLAQYYFDQFANERGSRVRGFSRAALEFMNAYAWPGNVRELMNRVRRAIVMCDRRLIAPEDLGLEVGDRNRRIMTLAEARAEAERRAIQDCLELTGHNISRAARELGISRVTLYRLMEKYGQGATASETLQ